MLLLMLCFNLTFLFQLFFNSTLSAVKVIRYFLDVVFVFNIISRFYIGYESHGVVITDAQQVQLTYLRSWFITDLLSVLPLEVLRYASPELHFMHFNRCLRVLRLFTIISSFSNEPDTNKIHVELLRSFSIMVICVQVSACIWFHQACEAAYDGHPRRCPKMKGWLTLLPEFSTNLKGATDLEYYAVSLYWAVITLTTVGYGEIHAMNGSETVVASVVMVIGLVAFLGAIMTGLSSIISNLDRRRGRFFHRMETICSYMKHMDLPEDVQTLVQTSYHYFWIHQKGYNAGGLFDDLPLALQSEVSRFRYKNILEKCKLLKETEDGFKSALSLKFKTQTFNPGHILSRVGEINQNLYYIERGQMKVFGRDKTDCIATLLPGFLIGEVGLMYKIPRNATICTATLCEVCVLENHDLLTLFADYPEAGVKIAEAARTRLYKVNHHIQEAFAFGHASMPDNVLFHKDLIVSSEAQDQKIVIPFRDFALKQTAHHNTGIKKFFWQKVIRPDSAFAKVWEVIRIWSIIVSIFILTWVLFFTNNEETVGFYSKGWGAVYLAVSYGIDIVAAADIFVTLHTAVVTKDENDMKKNVFKQRTAKCIFLLIFSVHCCSGILYVSACKVFRCDENSWAWNSGLKTAQCNFYHYMYAAYFSTTTLTTGYGDIVPSTMIERLASVIVAFIGLFVFNFIISQIYATLSSKNAARMDFQHLISATRLFMEQHDLSVSLQRRVIEYVRLLWTKYQGEAYPGGPFLMNDLPLQLQRTVLMNERGRLLLKIPYFEYTEQAFIEDLASASVMYYFPRGEIVQYSGTITRELFFVRRGTCQILNDDLSEIVGLYGEGMYFGEANFLFGEQAVRAKTYCTSQDLL
ncbi:potassium voltage-gated channel subfamily H member 7-like [Hoplias malabaricus]|uniref:potassium voltage-gated channel subfamily H member 7-like n=1 Tax=Hoplias malabaricus TaxID=27720 RepID=UPI003462A178